MKTKMFSIYDTKMESYGTPFFMPKRGAAMRAFGDLAKDPKSTIHQHPTDYDLYELAEYDDESGEIVACKPVNLGKPRMEIENDPIDLGVIRRTNGKDKEEVVS